MSTDGDRYLGLSDAELVAEAEFLYQRVAMFPDGTTGLIELRNIVPYVLDRMRDQMVRSGDNTAIPRYDKPWWNRQPQ